MESESEKMDVQYKRPAVFLDRDGVLVTEKSYVTSIKELDIFSYTAGCIQQIHQKGYYAIVITNQSGVARGLFTEEQLKNMNEYLIAQTGIDAVYYCPHHPKGLVDSYRKKCFCRKPHTALFETACNTFSIDMYRSYMVGDRASDIIAGKNVGVKTILLESGYGTAGLEKDVVPDYVCDDLRNVIDVL